MASSHSFDSQRKHKLSRDPLTAWTRLFNDNVDSLVRAGQRNAACRHVGKMKDDLLDKRGKIAIPRTKQNIISKVQISYIESECCDNQGETSGKWNQTSRPDNINKPEVNSLAIQEVGQAKGHLCDHSTTDETLEPSQVNKSSAARQGLCFYGGDTDTKVTHNGGHRKCFSDIKRRNYSSQTNISTPTFNLINHRLSSKYIFCYSTNSNGLKVILGIGKDANNLFGNESMFSNNLYRFRYVSRICKNANMEVVDSILLMSGTSQRKSEDLEQNFLIYPSNKSSTTIDNKSLESLLPDNKLFGPSAAKCCNDNETHRPTPIGESIMCKKEKYNNSSDIFKKVKHEKEKFFQTKVSSTPRSKVKALTRNPLLVWKRLFDNNVNSLVENGFENSKASKAGSGTHDVKGEGPQMMQSVWKSDEDESKTEFVRPYPVHACDWEQSATSCGDERHRFGKSKPVYVGNVRTRAKFSLPDPVSKSLPPSDYLQTDEQRSHDNTANTKLEELRMDKHFNYVEPQVSGQYLKTYFILNRQLWNDNPLRFMDQVHDSEYVEQCLREFKKRNKFTQKSITQFCGNIKNHSSVLKYGGSAPLQQTAHSSLFHPPFDGIHPTNSFRMTGNDYGGFGDSFDRTIWFKARCDNKSKVNREIDRLSIMPAGSVDTQAGGDYGAGNDQTTQNAIFSDDSINPLRNTKHKYSEKGVSIADDYELIKNQDETDSWGKNAISFPFSGDTTTIKRLDKHDLKTSFGSSHLILETPGPSCGDNELTDIKNEPNSIDDTGFKFDAKVIDTALVEENFREIDKLDNETTNKSSAKTTHGTGASEYDEFLAPASSFSRTGDLFRVLESPGRKDSVNPITHSSLDGLVSCKEVSEISIGETITDLRTSANALLSPRITDHINRVCAPRRQLALSGQNSSGRNNANTGLILNAYVDVDKNLTKSNADNMQNGDPSDGKKLRRNTPLVNPFNKTDFEEITSFLPTFEFNTKITRNDQILSSYFKQQEKTKVCWNGVRMLKTEEQSASISKSKDTMSLNIQNGVSPLVADNDKQVVEENVKERAGDQPQPIGNEGLDRESKCQSFDDLSESSIECLLEQLIERGKINKAFVMDSDGMVLARSKHTSISTHVAKRFYDSLGGGRYDGLMKIDCEDGNVYTCFKSADGAMFVGTSADYVTVCKRGANAVVVGFAQRASSGSCIKDMSELSDVLDKRGL